MVFHLCCLFSCWKGQGWSREDSSGWGWGAGPPLPLGKTVIGGDGLVLMGQGVPLTEFRLRVNT